MGGSGINGCVKMFGLLVGAALVTTSVSHAGIILSDSAVFSANSFSHPHSVCISR